MATFNPDLVTIARTRFSTTQGEVTLYYDGKKLERFGDTIKLRDGGWHGLTDAEWIDVARRFVRLKPDPLDPSTWDVVGKASDGEPIRANPAVPTHFPGCVIYPKTGLPVGVRIYEDILRERARDAAPAMLEALEKAVACLDTTLQARGYKLGSCADDWSPEVRLEVATRAELLATIKKARKG